MPFSEGATPDLNSVAFNGMHLSSLDNRQVAFAGVRDRLAGSLALSLPFVSLQGSASSTLLASLIRKMECGVLWQRQKQTEART